MSSTVYAGTPDTALGDMEKSLYSDTVTDPNVCKECGGFVTKDNESGEHVCTECGIVAGQIVSKGKEWRSFNFEEWESKSRVGSGRTPSKVGMGTFIFRPGRELKGERRSRAQKLRVEHIRAVQKEKGVRNLNKAMPELDRLAYVLNVPKICKEQAALVYRMALRKNIIKGRSIYAMVAASLIIGSKIQLYPLQTKKVAKKSPYNKKIINRCYRHTLRSLPEVKDQIPVADARICLPHIASRAGVSMDSEKIAKVILDNAIKSKISGGKDPYGLAAAAVYVGCLLNGEAGHGYKDRKKKLTQSELAVASGVTEVTIRNRYKELEKKLDFEIYV